MNHGAIPKHGEGTWHVTPQMIEKVHHVGAFDGPLMDSKGELALWRHAADDRKMGSGKPVNEHGCLAPGRIGTHHHRQWIKTRVAIQQKNLHFS